MLWTPLRYHEGPGNATHEVEESAMTHKTIIGIDLAKHLFQVCIVNHRGTLKTNTTVTRAKLLAFMARQPPALVVMEACGGAHDWARRFRAVGHQVRWLAPP